MRFDLLFKKIFGDVEHKERVSYLISSLLDIPYETVKNNIEILPGEKRINNKNSKRQAQDVVVRIILSVNRRVSLEMNMNYDITNKNRNLLYLSNMFSNQLRNREYYKDLEPCIQLNFNTIYTDNENKVLYDMYSFKNEYGNELTDMLKVININIAECSRVWYNKGDKNISDYNEKEQVVIKYGALMMEEDYDNIETILEGLEMEDEVKEDLLDTMEEYSEDEDFSYLYYDAERDRKAIENGRINEARDAGIKETKQEIAKQMKNENLDTKVISRCTGLTEEEINEL